MTAAGRFLVADWSVKGNGTRTRSPNSKLVIVGVVGVIPDLGERILGEPGGGLVEASVLVAQAKEVDEILDLGEALGGERAELLEELFLVGAACGLAHLEPPAWAERPLVWTRELTRRMTARRSFSGSAATCWNFFHRRRVPGSSWPFAWRTGLSPKSSSVETLSALASSTMTAAGGNSATVS